MIGAFFCWLFGHSFRPGSLDLWTKEGFNFVCKRCHRGSQSGKTHWILWRLLYTAYNKCKPKCLGTSAVHRTFHYRCGQRKEYMSIIDSLIESQRIVNQAESDICDIMRIPSGARLLQWSYTVRSTWWYKLFSRIDPRLNGRTESYGSKIGQQPTGQAQNAE